MSPTAHAPRSRRRAAALLLALPLLLTACGGDEDEDPAPRQAYTPGSDSSETAEASASASPSTTPEADQEESASAAPSSQSPEEAEPTSEPEPTQESSDGSDASDVVAEHASSDVICSGQQFQITRASDLTCGEALGMLDPFATSGQEGGRISDVECTVATGELDGREADYWECTRDPGGSLAAYHVPSDEGSGDSAEADTVACTGQRFWLTEVSDLTCGEALGMLDPFVTSGQEGGRISDVHCSVGSGEFQGETRDEWECTRDKGGSLVAYAK